MIKFWAFIYRLTGWYSPWARLAEYEALKKEIEAGAIARRMETFNAGLATEIWVTIGSWQAAHGFYRPFKRKEDRTKRFKKE